jgi:O-acetyl-ADP-ribose deacetylase (regulator of RNase III)
MDESMIHFTKGDMFDFDVDLRVNTVNCVGVMGAGVALAFKTRYPQMFHEYREACSLGEIRPGKMHVWKSVAGDWVINFPTKRHWREKSRYDDIHAGLRALRDYLDGYKGIRVALPALGCGNGGLDWERVAPMISENLHDLNAEIFVFEPADSLRLAKKKGRQSHDEVMRELEELGFKPFDLTEAFSTQPDLQMQVKGNAELLVNSWIALYTSDEIGAREFSALVSIATQMGLLSSPPTVALIYRNSASEDIAEIFLKNGLAVVMLLPFSPSVKKRVGLVTESHNRVAYAVVSIVGSSERKSAKLDQLVDNILRQGANAILLSDPNLEMYSKSVLKNLSKRPCFFVRYGSNSNELIYQLEQIGFRSIGRRADTGEPNLLPMIGSQSSVELPNSINTTAQITTLVTAEQLRNLAKILDQYSASQRGMYLSLTLDLMPEEMSSAVQRVLRDAPSLSDHTH